MNVNAVNYENGNPLTRVINATVIGGVIGYSSKHAIALQKAEKKDINYTAIVNACRKDANLKKINSFKILKTQTPAQDEFIKMIDHKENFKNPTLNDLAERVGGERTELGKKVLGIINDEKNKGIDVDGIINALGKDTKEAKEFKYASKLKNCFANYNIDQIINKLGGEASTSGKEFRRIVSEVDQESSFCARAMIKTMHKLVKDKRYTAPLVAAGATAGFAAAFIHNIFSHNAEA